ncbi:MAG: crotonobetainyl-CoA:carnitine CoA-transferase CaiB-like acyl-CoA transferase, partial [Candidatus Azotimanducaceae bacterium]
MLQDLRVIDAASFVAGPAAATVLGDFGANVIKVEPPQGDSYRSLTGQYHINYYWMLTSRNKRSIVLDISQKEGQETMLSLIDTADVLIVNFNADQLSKYGLNFEDLKKRNPRLIFAQITGYGTRGPEAKRRAFDVAAWWARSGIMDMMKPFGGSPTNGVGGVGDHASAMSLFGVIMMGLYQREKTGKGSYVSTSLAANGIWSNGMPIQGAIAGFDLAAMLDEQGFRTPFVLSYKTRDGRYIVLVGPNPQREWPLLCRAFGREDWLTDSRFSDMKKIMALRDEVRVMMADEFSKRKLKDLVLVLSEADVTYSVVEKLADVIEDAQLIENDILVRTNSDNPDYQWTVSSPIEVGGIVKSPIVDA